MRSDLIFCAVTRVTNRYQLCRLAAEATRKLHKPNTRTQDTTNNVLILMRESSPSTGASAPSGPAFLLGASSSSIHQTGHSAIPRPNCTHLEVSHGTLSPERIGV
jgi:hypothetical protein